MATLGPWRNLLNGAFGSSLWAILSSLDTLQLLSTDGSYHPPNAHLLPTLHIPEFLSRNRRILWSLMP